METVGEPYGFYPKLLKWRHFVPSVPKSLGQQAVRKIRSLEHFPAVCPPTRSTAASLKHRRCWVFPARHLGLRIVAIEEIGGGLETEIQRSPFSADQLDNLRSMPLIRPRCGIRYGSPPVGADHPLRRLLPGGGLQQLREFRALPGEGRKRKRPSGISTRAGPVAIAIPRASRPSAPPPGV